MTTLETLLQSLIDSGEVRALYCPGRGVEAAKVTRLKDDMFAIKLASGDEVAMHVTQFAMYTKP